MTVGLATATANALLNTLRGVSYSVAGTYVKLHTADPGAAGATAASVVTTRQQATFAAASAGSLTISNSPTFAMTATETITHISVWDAATAGTFLFSAALTTAKAVANTDNLNLSGLTVPVTVLAA